ncbi:MULTISPECIES: hypothetical protein [unclassified Butyrivibrio]|jgi:hypothetical protein|uniref:hypothetical protein n=1 Tax=unclassified Butyrivibrio TaxID=2639466 RepID=UPI00040F46DF|nr:MULTISPECIES: hypothetical protein [unclassified Butyrivibrio]MCR5343210.1 hypothetical protein [Butyrivibrio sp.]
MFSLFGNKLQEFDVDELKESAEKVLSFTGDKAKSAYCFASDRFEKLDNDKKNMIIIGLSVFAIVVVVAGIFYLVGKKAGRKEVSFEYEEWDS